MEFTARAWPYKCVGGLSVPNWGTPTYPPTHFKSVSVPLNTKVLLNPACHLPRMDHFSERLSKMGTFYFKVVLHKSYRDCEELCGPREVWEEGETTTIGMGFLSDTPEHCHDSILWEEVHLQMEMAIKGSGIVKGILAERSWLPSPGHGCLLLASTNRKFSCVSPWQQQLLPPSPAYLPCTDVKLELHSLLTGKYLINSSLVGKNLICLYWSSIRNSTELQCTGPQKTQVPTLQEWCVYVCLNSDDYLIWQSCWKKTCSTCRLVRWMHLSDTCIHLLRLSPTPTQLWLNPKLANLTRLHG